MADTTHPNGIL